MKLNEKGITIIVLIITITVMCILAGVSIHLILKDNQGAIQEATNARNAAKNLQEETDSFIENTYDEISGENVTTTNEDKFDIAVSFEKNTDSGAVLVASASVSNNQLPIASYKFYYKKTTDPDSKYVTMDKNNKTDSSARKDISTDSSSTNYNIKAVVIDSQGNTVTKVTTTNFLPVE